MRNSILLVAALTSAPLAVSADEVRAEQEVKVDGGSYGCESPERFQQAADHFNRGEYSAYAKITMNKPFCFSGKYLENGQTWTVLQVRGDMVQIGQATLKQHENDPSLRGHSYWTLKKWVYQPTASSRP